MRWRRVFALVLFFLLLGGGVWFLLVRMEQEEPALAYDEPVQFIGKATEWSFVAEDAKSGLRQIRVWVRQGREDKEVFAEDFPTAAWSSSSGVHRRELTVTFDPRALSLADGAATVIVGVQDNSLWGFKGNSTFHEFPVFVDTIAPRIDLVSMVHNVRKGGTGLVVFRLSEEPERAGVQLEDTFFPAYPLEAETGGAYLTYFAMPHDAASEIRMRLTARDQAGNETQRSFPGRLLSKKFPRDTIRITDRFLARKMPEFRAADPSLDHDPLKAYLKVNGEWRERDHQRLRQLCSDSEPRRLWRGAFLQMENTQNMSAFAVTRTYVYKGRVVDRQVHLGLDLASTSGASVPAANNGRVVMAGDLGIYGLTVLLDHGQGLFSLYAHLSSIAVTEGESVQRGQKLGSSGQTGMAGGDHLHFSMLASGEFVNPVEWLDDHWIQDNIENKLGILSTTPLL